MYRSEHPKPQFERESWQNLNGVWQFEIDNGNSGVARGLFNTENDYSMKIKVKITGEKQMDELDKFFRVPEWYAALAPFTWDTKFVKLRKDAIDALSVGMNEEQAKELVNNVDKCEEN